jgi:pyruvate dehydrogenase E1 component beta subunit
LLSALDGDDPVAYLEHKELWAQTGPVDPGRRVPLGRAEVVRAGRDICIVTWSKARYSALVAADALALEHGIEAEVIDLRSLWPWDRATVFASAARCRRLLVVHESVQAAGFGAEVAASVAEEIGVPVARLGAPRIPVGYAPVLEARARVGPEQIVARVRTLLEGTPNP